MARCNWMRPPAPVDVTPLKRTTLASAHSRAERSQHPRVPSGKFRVLYRSRAASSRVNGSTVDSASSPVRRCFRIDSAGFAGRYSSSTACQFRAQRPHDAAHRRDFSLFVLALMALGVAVGGAGCGRGGAARQDRSADPGERFFGSALLGRAIHCVIEATASSAPCERRADRIMSGYINREAVHPGYRLRVWLMP